MFNFFIEDFFVKPYRGYLTRTLGDYKENDSYIDYLMYGNDFKIPPEIQIIIWVKVIYLKK